VLDFADDALPPAALPRPSSLTTLSGPEGGFGPDELRAARAAGFVPLTLGPRVLRAETAPLALLAWAALAR
jgi:16S rRNA (uracil1498-N3)-methyltransferase